MTRAFVMTIIVYVLGIVLDLLIIQGDVCALNHLSANTPGPFFEEPWTVFAKLIMTGMVRAIERYYEKYN